MFLLKCALKHVGLRHSIWLLHYSQFLFVCLVFPPQQFIDFKAIESIISHEEKHLSLPRTNNRFFLKSIVHSLLKIRPLRGVGVNGGISSSTLAVAKLKANIVREKISRSQLPVAYCFVHVCISTNEGFPHRLVESEDLHFNLQTLEFCFW